MRPITIHDLNEFIKATRKQIRKELEILENDKRITKVDVLQKSNGRLCAAWVIADNDCLPDEIRDVCQVCGKQKADENHGAERVCHTCFLATKANGKRHYMDEKVEAEYSLWLATVCTIPVDGYRVNRHTEHNLGYEINKNS